VQYWRATWDPQLSFGFALALVTPLLAVLLVFVFYPVLELLLIPLQAQGFEAYTAFFRSGANVRSLEYTVLQSLAVTAGTLVLGAPIAWALRSPGPAIWKLVIWIAVLAPLWMNVVVKTYAFMMILGINGILSQAAQALNLISDPLDLLYTSTAVIIGMLHTMLPYAVLPLFVTFSTIDTNLLTAAESLGASRARAIMSVVVPLSKVGLLATGTIVFVICLGFYVTPIVLGGVQSPSMSSLVHGDMFMRFDPVAASTDSVILLIVAGAILLVMSLVIGTHHLRRVLG
jgi:ABC-type spermidine/putrescine transport system permease subunit I